MESVFKYIFAMIVGAMFILFFVGFGRNIISSSETMNAGVLVAGFDDYLFTLTANEMTKDDQNFGIQTVLNFGEGKISSGKNKPMTTNRIVYAPKTLSGTKITVRAIRWAFPYDIDSFFYITNARYKYVIVYDSTDESNTEFVTGLTESIKATFEVRNITKAQLNTQSYRRLLQSQYTDMSRVTFLLIGADLSNSEKQKIITDIPKAKFVFANGLGDGADSEKQWAYGSIRFDGEEDSYYIGNAMLMGAMYAENKTNYDFNFKRAMDRLAAVSLIYDGKIKNLQVAATECDYNPLSGAFASLANQAKEAARTENIESAQLSNMVSAVERMDTANSRELDCTAVF